MNPLDPRTRGIILNGRAEGKSTGDAPFDLWPIDADMVRLMGGTELFINSTNAADTSLFLISGIDDDGYSKELIIPLAGQTPISVGSWLRINFILNVNHINTLGDVYVCETVTYTAGVPDDLSKVQSYAQKEWQRSTIGKYTVPRKFQGWLTGTSGSVLKGTTDVFCNLEFHGGRLAGDFRPTNELVFKTRFFEDLPKWILLPEQADLKAVVTALSAPNVDISVNLFIFLEKIHGSD